MAKEAYIRCRVSRDLKERFTRCLKRDGLSETDWMMSRVIPYVEGKEKEKEAVKMTKMKLYYSNAAHRYSHGCQDSATWQDNGDGTATCLEATSCHSCWQVGHDYDHIYAEVGEVRPIDALPDLED